MKIYRSLDQAIEAGAIAPDSIVNADCLEAMKLIPDKSIDCIICDLPYGVTACKWDVVIPFDLLWEQYKRIIKPNGAIALFGSQPFTSALVMSNPKWFKYEWIWLKNNAAGFVNAKLKPMNKHENICIFSSGKTSNGNKNNMRYFPQGLVLFGKEARCGNKKSKENTYWRPSLESSGDGGHIQEFTNYPTSGIYFSKEKAIHPTQKPVPLIEYLIKTYSLEGEVILDNTSGSGTLAIAAINTNRRYICIEKDPDYFEVMRNRIENHAPNALVTPKKVKKPKAITEGQLALFG